MSEEKRDERRVLALDTSRMKGSVAVTRGDELLCEILFDASDTHSATLMPAIDDCMKTSRTGIEEIDLIAIVDGPGSFTGLRIGMATVKALAAVGSVPVAVVGSLEAMAAVFPFAGAPVMPVLDARRGEIYAALYDTSSGLPIELAGPRAIRPEDAAGMFGEASEVEGGKGRLIISGNGLDRYGKVLEDTVPREIRCAEREYWDPSAGLVAMLALRRAPVDPSGLSSLQPLYIRPPDAKLPRAARLKEGGGGK